MNRISVTFGTFRFLVCHKCVIPTKKQKKEVNVGTVNLSESFN